MRPDPAAVAPASGHDASTGRARFDPVRGWYAVAILSLLYAISFMDRFMLALLVEPVSRELGVGDAAMGLLLGGGFAAVYAVAGLPLAYILDRSERRKILAAGVIVWSLATMMSAAAESLTTLALCRAGVAVGEAVLTPAAVSLIADLFPRERRGLPISIYSAVSSVMVTGSLIINGAALDLAAQLQPLHGLAPWRFAFVIVGMPGVVLALLFYLTVREPVRGGMDGSVNAAPAAVRAEGQGGDPFMAYLLRQRAFYLPFYCAVGCLSMYSFAVVTWVPSLIVRHYGETAATAGYLLGMVGAPAALLGVFLWPWLAGRFDRNGQRKGVMTAYALAVAVVAPLLVLVPIAPTIGLLLTGSFLVICCTSASGCLVQLTVQSYGPSRMRARLMAIALLFINLIGYTLGPLVVVILARYWPGSSAALGYGLAVLGSIVATLSLFAILAARRAVSVTSLLDEID